MTDTIHTPRPRASMWRRLVAALGLLALAAALHLDPVRSWASSAVGAELAQANRALIDEARTTSLRDLALLAEILALLDVVQTAQIGFDFIVSAQIEAGRAIGPVVRGAEFAAMGAAAGVAVYEAIDLVLATARAVSPAILQVALAVGALFLVVQPLHVAHPLRGIADALLRISAGLFLVLFLVLPYSVHLAGQLAAQVPIADYQRHARAPAHLHDALTSTRDMPGFDGWSDKDVAKRYFEALSTDLPHASGQLHSYAIETAALNFGLAVVVPLLLVWAGTHIVRRLLRDTLAFLLATP